MITSLLILYQRLTATYNPEAWKDRELYKDLAFGAKGGGLRMTCQLMLMRLDRTIPQEWGSDVESYKKYSEKVKVKYDDELVKKSLKERMISPIIVLPILCLIILFAYLISWCLWGHSTERWQDLR